MLRYDSCYPEQELDSGKIEDGPDADKGDVGATAVRLEKIHIGKGPNLTPARWITFSWHLDEESISTEKIG